MEKSVFEKIADNEIPSHIIWENENHLAFLDIAPHITGQTVVIPKKNIGGYIFNLNDEDYQNLLNAAKEVAKLLKKKVECHKVVMLVEGFEVEHVHIKLYPANNDFHITQSEPIKVSNEELRKTQRQIIE